MEVSLSRTLLTVLLIGCAGKSGGDTGPLYEGEPHVLIASPDAGGTVSGCFVLEVEVYNFTLVSPVDEPEVAAGRGHFHAVFGPRYFDCEDLRCDIALTGDLAGDISVVAQLVHGDHTSVEDTAGTPVSDTRTFAYSGEPCAP